MVLLLRNLPSRFRLLEDKRNVMDRSVVPRPIQACPPPPNAEARMTEMCDVDCLACPFAHGSDPAVSDGEKA